MSQLFAITTTQQRPTVWQVTGSGVRPVVILRAGGTTISVSRLIANGNADGPAFVCNGRASAVPMADLFAIEGDARDEFARRRRQTYSSLDRRCRAVRAGASAP